MAIKLVTKEGTLNKYYSVYNEEGEHLFCTTPSKDVELLQYTDTTVTIRDGNNVTVYDCEGNLIKTTENNDLMSCMKTSKTPVFKIAIDLEPIKQDIHQTMTETMFKLIGFLILICWAGMAICWLFHIPL